MRAPARSRRARPTVSAPRALPSATPRAGSRS